MEQKHRMTTLISLTDEDTGARYLIQRTDHGKNGRKKCFHRRTLKGAMSCAYRAVGSSISIFASAMIHDREQGWKVVWHIDETGKVRER